MASCVLESVQVSIVLCRACVRSLFFQTQKAVPDLESDFLFLLAVHKLAIQKQYEDAIFWDEEGYCWQSNSVLYVCDLDIDFFRQEDTLHLIWFFSWATLFSQIGRRNFQWSHWRYLRTIWRRWRKSWKWSWLCHLKSRKICYWLKFFIRAFRALLFSYCCCQT